MRRRLGLLAILVAAGAALVGVAAPVTAELVQRGTVRFSFDGGINPHKLPRDRPHPVSVWLGATFVTTDGKPPPPIQSVDIDINGGGVITTKGLPKCPAAKLVETTTQQALKVCGPALIGIGRLTTQVTLPDQPPFPTNGVLLAFNSVDRQGHQVILTHLYGVDPGRVTYVLPFTVTHHKGVFGLRLHADFPTVASGYGYIGSFFLQMERTFKYKGKRRHLLAANCPAPKPLKGALYPLARGTFNFVGGLQVSTTLDRSCEVKGSGKRK